MDMYEYFNSSFIFSISMELIKNAVIVVVAIFAYRMYLKYSVTSKVDLSKTFDYIVVGGGSAGATVAYRLAEDGTNQVLLLEAGIDDESELGKKAHIPLMFGQSKLSEYDWKYYTEPQENACLAMKDKKSYWPRGFMLGGSSIINAMIWTRGSRHDYDKWAADGASGWSYAEVLPYFIRMENNQINDIDHDYHGKSGPTKVTKPNETPELTEAVLNAAKEIGEKEIDCNGREQNGWSSGERNTYNGVRQSTANTYLKEARKWSNLHIVTLAHVGKIRFEGKRARGVEYIHNGRLKYVSAEKEIILSAGAIGSPQLLMLSGIGPKKHLQEHKIPVIANLPVGENMLDHLYFDMPYLVDAPITITPDRISSLSTTLQYTLWGSGLLSVGGAQAMGYRKAESQPKDDQRPYLQFFLVPTLLGCDGRNYALTADRMGLDQAVFAELYNGTQNKYGFTIFPKILHPKSVGNIKLKSTNPFDHPAINPNYLNEDIDVEVVLDGIKYLKKLEKTKAFKKIGARPLGHHHPGCKEYDYDTDDYWRCYIRHNTFTMFHATCTCKMGTKDDASSVVDSNLKVHGIEGLRVVDASVMPDIPSGPTNAPVIMIAEKAADIILGKPPLTPLKHL